MLDDLGAPVELPRSPRRVVSLVPSLTEAIAATVPSTVIALGDTPIEFSARAIGSTTGAIGLRPRALSMVGPLG